MKNKLLLIGAFPKGNKKNLYGGQLTACNVLVNSKLKYLYDLSFLDSTLISIPPPNILTRAKMALKRIFILIFKLAYLRPNIIIIFIAGYTSSIEKGVMILIAKLFKKKIMIFPRAGELITKYKTSYLFKIFVKFTFQYVNKFLCQGKSFQDFAISEFKFKKEDCPILPNWSATDTFLNIGLERNYSKKKEKISILFIGWLERYKGVYEIIEAASMLKENNKYFHIYLGGDGNYMKEAKLLIKEKNLEEYISILGWINKKEKIKLLKESDIFILPSWNEGLPNAMIEAMSSGLASIVSAVGVIPDYIINGKNGLLIKPKCPDELVESIVKLMNNRILLETIQKNSFKFAKNNFTIENALNILNKEINSL